jgi:hypothetical protein
MKCPRADDYVGDGPSWLSIISLFVAKHDDDDDTESVVMRLYRTGCTLFVDLIVMRGR